MFGIITPANLHLLQHAESFGLFLTTSHPKIIDEMLPAQGDTISFLFTAEPKGDTSDAIISPFCNMQDIVCDNLVAIQKWLEELTLHPDVSVTLYITEGYDIHFDKIAVLARDLASTLCEILRRDGDWPSLEVRIIRAGEEQGHR